MENQEALGIPKGSPIVLTQPYATRPNEEIPAGTRCIVQNSVDMVDTVFVTATVDAGQPLAGHTETLPASYWGFPTNGKHTPASDVVSQVQPTPPMPPTPPKAPPVIQKVAPLPEVTPPPWETDEGEVAEMFQQCAPDSEAARKFYDAYLTVNPPFDDAQLRDLLELVEVSEGEAWTASAVGRMFYAFNQIADREQDPIVFEACPALRAAIEEARAEEREGEVAPKKRGRPRKKPLEEEEAVPARAVSLVPPGVADAERKLQGLPPHNERPSMGVAPPPVTLAGTEPVRPTEEGHCRVQHLAGEMLKELSTSRPADQADILEAACRIVKATLQA